MADICVPTPFGPTPLNTMKWLIKPTHLFSEYIASMYKLKEGHKTLYSLHSRDTTNM